MTDHDTEFKKKICKKIAQLTRVIFELNVQQESNSQLITTLVKSYEQDIANISSDYMNDKTVSQSKDAIRQLQSQLATADETAKLTFDQLKLKFSNEKDKLRMEMDSKQLSITLQAKEDKLASLTEKYQALYELIHSQKRNFEERQSRLERTYTTDLSMEKERNELLTEEINNLRHAYGLMDSELNKARGDIKTKSDMIEKLEKEILAFKQSSSKAEAELIESLKKEKVGFRSEIAGLKAELEKLKVENNDLIAGNLKLSQENSGLVTGIRVMETKRAEAEQKLEDQIENLKYIIGQLEGDVESSKKDVERLNQSLTDRDRTISGLTEELKKFRNNVKAQLENQKSLEEDLEVINSKRSKFENMVETLSKELRSLKIKYAETEKLNADQEIKIVELEALVTKYQSESSQLNTQIIVLTETVTELREQLQLRDDGLADQDGRLAEAKRRINELEHTLKSETEAKQRLIDEVQGLKAERTLFENNLLNFDISKQQLVQQYEERLTILQTELNETRAYLERLRSTNRRRIASQHDRINSVLEVLNNHKVQVSALSALEKREAGLMVKLTAMAVVCTNKLSGENSMSDELKQKTADLQTQIAGGEREVAKLQARIDELERANTNKTSQYVDLQLMYKQLTEEHEQKKTELARLLGELEMMKTTARNNLSEHQANTAKEIENIKRELEDRLQAAEFSFKTREEELRSANRSLIEKLAALQAELRETVEKMQDDFKNRLRHELDKRNKAAFANLEQVKKALNEDCKLRVDAMLADHKEKLDKLLDSREAEIQKLKVNINEVEGKLSEKEQTYSHLLSQYTTLNYKFDLLKSEFKEAKSSYELEHQSLVDEIEQLKFIHQEEVNQLNAAHASKLSELVTKVKQDCTDRLANITSKFTNLKASYSAVLFRKDGDIREITNQYNNRPSKRDDLVAMENYKREIAENKQEINKAKEQMKFYKLELINREKNYNQIFGANPNIGVLNPLKYGTSGTRENQNDNSRTLNPVKGLKTRADAKLYKQNTDIVRY